MFQMPFVKSQSQRDLEDRLQVTRPEFNGFHCAIRRALQIGRILGLLPLRGLSTTYSEHLRFTLVSPYALLYFASLAGQSLMFVTSLYWLIQTKFNLTNVTNFLFYTLSVASLIILANIGRSLPKLMVKVEEIERTLPPIKRNIPLYCNLTMIIILLSALDAGPTSTFLEMFVILSTICFIRTLYKCKDKKCRLKLVPVQALDLAIVEHLLSVHYGYTVAKSCDSNNIAETFFHYDKPWIFNYTTYNIWKGMIVEALNIQATFIWSYNDILIMVISIYLAEHFVIHNKLLKKALMQTGSTGIFSCDDFRIQYLQIVRLVRLINNHVGIYILTCFGSNLYWICTQLFYSLNLGWGTFHGYISHMSPIKPLIFLLSFLCFSFILGTALVAFLGKVVFALDSKNQTGHFISCTPTDLDSYVDKVHGIEHTIYFTYSVFFLVARTFLVLMLAARVHSKSVVPLCLLHEIPTRKFNIEIERYISQINNVKAALTGLDFFYVTRKMILTLLRTIVTYELVLLQFNK